MERESHLSKEITVDGFVYLVQHPQVEEAWEIGIELLKLIGGSAAAMASGADSKEKAGEALSQAVNGLLMKLSPQQTMGLMKKLLRYVELQRAEGGENKKLLLDNAGIQKHFHGRVGSMMRLVGEVLAFTHADFFEAVSDGVASIMKKAAEKVAA